jgi:glycine cleavage system H protein
MKVLEGLYYSKEHEWVKVEGEKAYIGITDYAQHSLGDIVFVELPEVEAEFELGETMGVVESVKAASDVYIPLTCVVTGVNIELEETPQLLNQDPYTHFLAEVLLKDESELEGLMNAEAYLAFCEE